LALGALLDLVEEVELVDRARRTLRGGGRLGAAGLARVEGLDVVVADQAGHDVARALDDLIGQRAVEGAALASEIRALRAELVAEVATMAARAPQAAARRGDRLRERLRALLADAPVDETRIMTEVAVWAQKTDVTEELARLRAHLDEVGFKLDKGGAVGRPLDFLIQELNREVNTVGAKADDLELSQATLAAKGVLEKMREQVQNLE